MGRLTLMLVMAAAISGAVFTVGTRSAMTDTDRSHAEGQADVLAREIAEAGQSVALAQMVSADGFVDPTDAGRLGTEQGYDGGAFHVDYTAVPPPAGEPTRMASVRVTGAYGGAVHTVESGYRFDPMDAPGPLWLDVPHVVSTVSGSPSISGGAPVVVDRRKHDELELEGLVPMADLQANVAAIAAAGGAPLSVPAASEWTGDAGLLEDLNVNDGEGLYQLAVAQMSGSDQTFAGDTEVTGSQTWGRNGQGDDITHVDGDLTVSGTLRGYGALLVNGAFRVTGRLRWEGLIVVRSDEDVLPIELDGTVDVTGMVVVAHQAFAPGGHLDVSVYHAGGAPMTAAAPWGDFAHQVWPWTTYRDPDTGARAPFVQHTHAFDLTPTAAPRGDDVYFLEGAAAGRHGTETQLRAFLNTLDADELIQLEFANADEHGFSTFGLAVDGEDAMDRGSVQAGFGEFSQAGRPRLSKPFRAGALRDFDVDIRSLRALRRSFDTDGTCDVYPICIGEAWDRRGALALRVVRASDASRLYEATFYWHMREDEEAAHEAEEQAWRDRIAAGEAFGTTLAIGDGVSLTYDIGEVSELADKLLFDGNEVVLVASRSAHITAAEGRATGDQVCHVRADGQTQTMTLPADTRALHFAHGDTAGPCPTAPATGGPLCVRSIFDGQWHDMDLPAGSLRSFLLATGAMEGTCAANGRAAGPSDDDG